MRDKHDRHRPTGPTQRMLRVGELVRHALAGLFARGEIEDDLLAGKVITVPEVRMSPDLKLASAYVMPLGGEQAAEVVARRAAFGVPHAGMWFDHDVSAAASLPSST